MMSPRRLMLALALPTTVLAADAQPSKVNFQDHVMPIFRNACLNCHNADKKKGGLDISSYGATIAGSDGSKVVMPGDADASLLYKTMAHLEEPKMPQKADKLPAKDLQVIKDWINGGALESANSRPGLVKPKVDLSVVAAVGKPTGPVAFPKNLPTQLVVKPKRPGPLTALASSPWAPVVALGAPRQVLLFNADTLDLAGVVPFAEGQPNILRFSRSGNLLLIGGGEGAKLGRVVLADVNTGKRIAEVGEEYDAVLSADVSADQTLVALGTPSRLVKLHSTADGHVVASIKKHTDWVTAVAFSPDGKYLASGDRQGNCYVWEATTGRELLALAGHKGGITALSFRDDSKVLASSSEDGTVKLWNPADGSTIKSVTAHAGGVLWVDFTHDGRLVSAGRDKTAKSWKANGDPDKSFAAFPDIALRTTFTHDGNRVIAGDWSGQVNVFAAADGKQVGQLSTIPLTPAEKLVALEKRLPEVQAAHEKAQSELKVAEAALAKANEELAAANKALADKKASAASARELVAGSGARVQEQQGKLESARQKHKVKSREAEKLAEKSKAATAARHQGVADLKALQQKAEEANKLAAAARNRAAAAPADKEAMKAAEKAVADAGAAKKAVAAKVEEIKSLNAAETKAKDEQVAAAKSADEANKAVVLEQGALEALNKQIAEARAVRNADRDTTALKGAIDQKTLAVKAATEKLAPFKAAADKAASDLTSLKSDLARLKNTQTATVQP